MHLFLFLVQYFRHLKISGYNFIHNKAVSCRARRFIIAHENCYRNTTRTLLPSVVRAKFFWFSIIFSSRLIFGIIWCLFTGMNEQNHLNLISIFFLPIHINSNNTLYNFLYNSYIILYNYHFHYAYIVFRMIYMEELRRKQQLYYTHVAHCFLWKPLINKFWKKRS